MELADQVHLEFPAMGTECSVTVYGMPRSQALDAAKYAQHRIELLERRWSRFQPMSELVRLNETAGLGPVPVSADTVTLIQAMIDAWKWSEHWCDASVLPAVEAAGYDTDFLLVSSRTVGSPSSVPSAPVPGMGGVEYSHDDLSVSLPSGVRLDPGGIGKGLAGDLVLRDLMSFGAKGAVLDLGGDLSLDGAPGSLRPWRVQLPGTGDVTIAVPHSRHTGVATSSTRFRRWAGGHHLVDPTTGMPSSRPVRTATAVAGSAWQAEAASKVALLSPNAQEWFVREGLWARLERADGTPAELGSIAREVPA